MVFLSSQREGATAEARRDRRRRVARKGAAPGGLDAVRPLSSRRSYTRETELVVEPFSPNPKKNPNPPRHECEQGRRDNSNKDEPFAFDSREFLRKKLIGRQVKFRIDYAVPSIGREFGQVYLGEENVGLSVVTSGWAKCRSAGGEQASNYEDLARAEQSAQAGELGMWTKDPAALARAVRTMPEGFNAQALLPANKGKPLPAVVEAVLNGSCLRVMLLTDSIETRYATATVFLAGIQCPAMTRRAAADPDAAPDAPKPEAQPEPFAREAKHFTEVKLLNREVRVVLEGTDKYQNLFCSVLYAEEGQPVDIAEQLSRAGLAKVVDWSAAMMAGGATRLRTAERAAKEARARLWKNYVAPPPSANSLRGNNFTAKVVEVVSGDVVVVADVDSGVERRVNLSSIRAPKIGNERRGQKPEPWAVEAKEFLRGRCIGSTVKVSMEYSRKIGGGNEGDGAASVGGERTLDFGTVKLPAEKNKEGEGGVDQLNLAEMLVLRGLASVIRHRGDEERSMHYDELMQAEQRAIKGKKGIQNKDREAPTHHVNDVSQNAAKSKQFLPFLTRAGRCQGMVDFVMSGHRLKITIPKEGVTIAFSLSGVRCPQGGRGDSAGEPFAADALRFTRHRCLQREVEIEVETVDKTGTFLGSITMNGGRFNLGIELLRAGLGQLHPMFQPERHSGGAQLQEAQQAAKMARACLWKDWSPEAEAAKAAAKEASEKAGPASTGPAEITTLGITEVISGCRFFAQRTEGSRADALFQQLQDLTPEQETPNFAPRKGMLLAGRFTGDNCWYRAVVTEHPSDASAGVRVHYCDFGNGETLPRSRIRPLDPSLASLPPLAHLCTLSFLKVPDLTEEHGHSAARCLGQLAGGRALPARIDQRAAPPSAPWDHDASPEWHVTLGGVSAEPSDALEKDDDASDDGDSDDREPSVNEQMCAEGFARLEKWATRKSAAKGLAEAQEQARKARLGMWEYGDVDSDDDEPAPKAPGAWGRRR